MGSPTLGGGLPGGWWQPTYPGLATDVMARCKECAACNRAKVTRQPTTTVEKMAIPARFSMCVWTLWGLSLRHVRATPTSSP